MTYTQNYDPFNNPLISTLVAFLPIIILLGGMLLFRLKAQIAAALGLAVALVISLAFYRFPASMAAASVLFGAAYGLFPIGWIILNILFLFRLVEEKKLFSELQASLSRITPDLRLQLLIVVLCLGSFFEGVSGFGTPVAITSILLIGLGFPNLQAAVLSLIGNSTPVMFGSIGTGLLALQTVTGLDLLSLSKTAAWQLIPLNLILASWLVWAFAGFRRMVEVLPAILVVSGTYTVTQAAMAIWHGPWLPSLVAPVISLVSLLILMRFWKPRHPYQPFNRQDDPPDKSFSGSPGFKAWLPWILLSTLVFLWGIPGVKTILDTATLQIQISGLDGSVFRTPPLATGMQPVSAIFSFNWLSSIGTAVLLSSLGTGLLMKYSPRALLQAYTATLRQAAGTLLTISLLVALGYVSRYAGIDATLGLAFALSGVFYPFFGTVLGWLGVLSTGSITSSNVLFGNLQQISATRVGIDPVIMATANATGGVAGKLISPQSIAITASATAQSGREHLILRKVLPHSLAMIIFMGLIVFLEALIR